MNPSMTFLTHANKLKKKLIAYMVVSKVVSLRCRTYSAPFTYLIAACHYERTSL